VFERWNWKESEHVDQFRDESFCAMDPGASGKVLAYEKGNRYPVLAASSMQPEDVARIMRVVGARVLVAEAQYVTQLKSARGIVELAFRSGIVVGYLIATRAPVHVTHLFEVAAASWQAHQRGHKGARPKRAEMLKISALRALAECSSNETFRLWWAAEVAAGREGLASALGIGDHWKHVAWT
jgi:hypothetical protein